MIAGLIHWRTYLLIGLGIAAVVFLLNTVTGAGETLIIPNLMRMRGAAVAVGMSSSIADVIVQPVIAVFQRESGIVGAVFAGLLWPLGALWLILVVLLFFFSVLGSGFDKAADTIR